ncbi:hypothetical protein ACQ4M4_11430 [Leptolyngbya sp. AN02str]|uniref:hypothetical protein n=1 Tax=Leptolyngbya sp. AN02str TaxID=3423363 RepID=UPI003D322E2C
MQTLAFEPPEPGQFSNPSNPLLLETFLIINLEEFPELTWLSAYLTHLRSLQSECDRITHAIQSIAAMGDIHRGGWIEAYTKTKKGKEYTYYQLRWLAGERKQSGQPKVKTKHLSRHAVAEAQTAIARGEQVKALEKERQQVEAEIERIKYLVRGTSRRLQQVISQNFNLQEGKEGKEGNHDDQ